ncbi:hypothetical protein HPB51_008545 [Rhipicephalus microplus]|uniref:Tick transposon n=1 Tax=Rhipicephalus microplus TaxID=6941 RepID=A0A9J6D439_RHIMP|nr:hypothetical protein HPB51_008545 [Rhipicephalus microplus]
MLMATNSTRWVFRGPKSDKFPDTEKAVLEYVKDMRKDGHAVSLDMIRTQAGTVSRRLGIATKDFRTSSGWTTRFMRRNKLSLAFSTRSTKRKMTVCGTVKTLPVPTKNRAATALTSVTLRSMSERKGVKEICCVRFAVSLPSESPEHVCCVAPVAMASAASPSGVKKRRALSLEIMECVIRDIECGLKKASVAAKYGVSDTTVSTIYKNKDKLRQQLQQDSFSLSRKRIRTSKYEDVDAALFRWFREVRAQSIPVSGPMLQQKAKSLEALSGHDDFNPLNGWIQRFKDRHGISCKVVCRESSAVDDESIEVWLRLNLEKFVDAGESEPSVCEKASTDDTIVAAVRGSAEVATDDESDGEDDVDPTPEPDFLCKDALEYLAKVKTYCAKNSLSEKSLQCLSFVEDEIVRSAVRKHRQMKITAFFC